ncbi:MAG: FeoB-associated Cys-rich membrane protein [Oscillospiraceae bacterium]|nr:FeoB-associated Cys-rich membrane protein [Oscillospiraceae bacterium]
MGIFDWLLLGLILLAAAFALRRTLRSKGSCSCGGSCSGCSGNCASCGGNCASCGQSCTCGKAGKTPPEG